VARGREPIDERIDLHGMTQSQTHAALLRFLRRAQAAGARTVLVVTGKGSGKASDLGARDAVSERGVLRRQVPLWLALPEFRPLVVGFDAAHVGHGGQGALYVRLRREK
jgi:DNA-nicking Smr family endonuclease